jgi:ABC-2 type transport system permease protein
MWSVKNDILRFDRSFYKKTFFYILLSLAFMLLFTMILTMGMMKLQTLSVEVFSVLVIKGFSLVFLIISFMQVINGFVMSFNKYYQSRELDLLFTSPVSRISLFFSRLLQTHLKTSWMFIVFGIPLLAALGLHFQTGPLYYLCSMIALISFSIIPVNIGIGITIVLAGIFHIKRLKKFVFFAGVISVIGIIMLLRLFKPERFVNPEAFASLKIFLSELRTPSYILFPNRWLSETLFNVLEKNYAYTLLFLSLLVLTAYVTVFLLMKVYKGFHYRGWSRLQGEGVSGGTRRKGRSEAFYLKGVRALSAFFDRQSSALFIKDILYQFHDIKNIQQNLILLSLIVVYLFSIASLPLNWEEYGVQLQYTISFFNLGLILVIIASLCSKLVYPAIVTAGDSLWIIKTSPITSKRYIWTKFFFLFLPIFILGQLLTVFSSVFVHVEKTIFSLNVLTTTLMCFSLVGLAISFGINDLKRITKGSAGEEIKTGNTFYMITSVLFIVFILFLELIPLYLYFLKEAEEVVFTQKTWLLIGTVIAVLFLVNIITTAVSMHLNLRRFDDIQMQ